jgi:phosphatidylethanolamine/phosphatidyl-N-methylethanolamine N-methyltransferase
MRPDPSHDEYLRQWSQLYEKLNYDEGLAGYFLDKSHAWCERAFGPDRHFSRVLEVGAGTGVHLAHVRHGFDQYLVTDLNPPMLASAEGRGSGGDPRVSWQAEDATSLSFPDASFDRLVAAHVLEHLPAPHAVLREWSRVVKPGGVISLVLPCDPGLAWRLGRAVGSRGKFVRAGLEYDYWMAREHINAINGLTALVEYYFPQREEAWLPMRIPSMDLNLFYIAHLRNTP